jgi:very-short-patch-repair endonuclease/predicted transcriptional regulator of viral defense system
MTMRSTTRLESADDRATPNRNVARTSSTTSNRHARARVVEGGAPPAAGEDLEVNADVARTADDLDAGSVANLSRRADGVIEALAARQHGVVTRAQVVAAGAPLHALEYRVKSGRLHRIHRGVYRVGPAVSPWEREAAAVLACGEGGVLSDRTAGVLWSIVRYPTGDVFVHVSVQGGGRRIGRGVCVHRIERLGSDERTVLHGLPITTPARTILDLARTADAAELEQAIALAEREGLVSREELGRLMDRYPRRPGTAAVRALLVRESGVVLTRSKAEALMVALFRKARLRMPEVNARVCGFEVDFVWRAEKLVVEVDGAAFHTSTRSFESDRRRDAMLAAAGFRVIRVTWRQLVDEPEAVIVRIAQALMTKP